MLNFLTTTTVCGFSLYHVLAFFLIYSCTGWCLEVIYAAVTTGQLINRGFLNGPVCPIYGFGMVIVLFALTPLSHSLLLLYLGGVLLPSALELVGGWALYKLYHTRWWDYSDYPFNIGGYICLEFSLLWGVGTLIVMKLVHPIIADTVALIPPLVGLILMFLLYAIYAADTIATAFAASDLARDLDALEKVADSMHAVSDAMTELLGTNAMAMDQKMDESRLQFKLAAAEARDNAAKLNAREAAAAMRAKADEAMEAARRASQTARLNAAEAAKAVKLAAQGTPVLGVCGGYQMLGEQLCDPAGEESGTPCTLRGLGLLPTTTVFGTEKHLTQTAACVTTEPFAGAKLTGYEIHAGRTEVRGSAFCILADGTPEGCVQDSVFGTYLHGLFDTGELTEKLTAFLCKRKGIDPAGAELIPMEQYRQQQFDLLADGVRAALDMPAIYAAMGMQKGDNT